jgi:hypothetical protein
MATTNFFISYTGADDAWAQWIAWQLEATGYTTTVQAWDSRPGMNFLAWMNQAATQAERTLVVLSPAYEQAEGFTVPEWTAAMHKDPSGSKGCWSRLGWLSVSGPGCWAHSAESTWWAWTRTRPARPCWKGCDVSG